jgi:hypothetical protein
MVRVRVSSKAPSRPYVVRVRVRGVRLRVRVRVSIKAPPLGPIWLGLE